MNIKRVKHSFGQTLIEFALILTVLVLIVMGIFEFGRILQAWLTVQNSAQAAARYATTGQQSVAPAVDQWDAARLAAIKAEALRRAVSLSIRTGAAADSPGYFNVFVYASDTPVQGVEYPGGPNARVAVDVVYNHTLITPLVNMIAPFITLRGHAEMINERFRHPGFGTPAGVLPPTIFPTPIPVYTATPTRTLPSGSEPTFTATSPAENTPTLAPVTPSATPVTPSATPVTPSATVTIVATICPPCGVWGYPACPPGCSRRTATPAPPTATPVTPTRTATPVTPTHTATPVIPTRTATPVAPTPTSTPCPWYCSIFPSLCPPECRP